MTLRRRNVNTTEATDRQVENLGAWGHGSFTAITRTAIDRMWNQEAQAREGAMDEYISISVTGEELFGNWQNTELYDEDQSVLEYTEQLCAALAEVFRCSIEVLPGDVGKVALGIDNGDDRPRVDQIIGQVYESYAWVRYTREGVADSLDTGFWVTREDGVTVSVGETEDGAYLMSYHKGEMPAHSFDPFETREALLDAMETIAPFECWNPVAMD